MPAHTSVKLNTGAEMPVIGLGTWQSKPEQVRGAVQYALEIGYRHIDTAAAYGSVSLDIRAVATASLIKALLRKREGGWRGYQALRRSSRADIPDDEATE